MPAASAADCQALHRVTGAPTNDRFRDVLGLAVLRWPASGRGRPRGQAEHGSLASGCPAASHDEPTEDPERLTPPEWLALQHFADGDRGVIGRWPVGRAVSHALVHRGLVIITSEWVLLTEAGRRALEAAGTQHLAPPRRETSQDPQTSLEWPMRMPAATAHEPSATPPTCPSHSPEPAEPKPLAPPGVLHRASRTNGKRVSVLERSAAEHCQPEEHQVGQERRKVRAV